DENTSLSSHDFGIYEHQNCSFILFPGACSVIMTTDHEKHIQGLKELNRIHVGYHNEHVQYPVPVIVSKDEEWSYSRPTTQQTTTVLASPSSNNKKDDDEFCNTRQLQHSRKSIQTTASTRSNYRQLPSHRYSSFSQYHIPSLTTTTQFRSTPNTTTMSQHHNNNSPLDDRFSCLFPPPNRNVSEINQFDKSLQNFTSEKLPTRSHRKNSNNNRLLSPPSPTNSTSSSSSISYSLTRQTTAAIPQVTIDCPKVRHPPISEYNHLSLSGSSISSCSENERRKKTVTSSTSSFPLLEKQLITTENDDDDDALSDSSLNRILTSTTNMDSQQPITQRLSRKIFAKLFPSSFSVSKS
ncbi:unnamed protein product, partial [Didymodactylos carnosus]